MESRTRWWVVSLLFLGALINYVDRGNLSIAAVPLMRDFRRSPAAMGVLLSAFFWSYAFLQIPAGYLIDRFGLKWTYGGAFLLWSLASAATGLATSFFEIVVLRVVLGITEAAVTPASLTYIKQQFSSQEQGLPTGIFLSGMIIGPAVGALVGSALVSEFGWRVLFILTGTVSCLWLLPWFRIVPATDKRIIAQVPGVKVSFAWRELMRLRPVWAIIISAYFYSYFWYFYLTWLPSYLLMARGFSFMKMGAYTALPLVVMACLAALCGRAADVFIKRGRPEIFVRKVFVGLGFVLGSAILLLLRIKSSTDVFAILVLSIGGLGLATGNYWAVTETLVPDFMAARVIGFQNMIANVAGISAPALTGWLIGETKNFALSILFAGASLWVAAAAFMWLLRNDDPQLISSRFTSSWA